jgi:ferrochelatase
MAERYPYQQQFEESAAAVAAKVGGSYSTVYQSRSGRPEDPWLGPDICDYLREERTRGLEAAVICPLGFVCDHIEVLYDLDVEAAAVCREIGLPMVRAQAVNDHARFLDTLMDAVLQVYRRYAHARPLELVGEA